MKKILLAGVIGLLMSGCASSVHKDMHATGGSKSDGIIELSFEHTEFEKPILDEQKNYELAKKRCESWGYSKAEAFGGSKRQCQMLGGWSGCASFLITKQYQCID